MICYSYGNLPMATYCTVYGTVPSWHYQCKNGLRKASPPHFLPPACSSHVLTPHNASLNNPEAGLGLRQLRGRAQQWLAWKLKSRTRYLIPA